MSKVAVVYWSGTGNTEAMAMAVAEGAKGKGAEVSVITAAEFSPEQVGEYSAIAFGCPSMGAEQLEESEFEPMFTACEGRLSGKNIALFGSYGWGDGEWMRSWESRCSDGGANLACDSVICNEAPDDDALAQYGAETDGVTSAGTRFGIMVTDISGLEAEQRHSSYSQSRNGHFACFPFFYRLVVIIQKLYDNQFRLEVATVKFITFGKRGLHFGRCRTVTLALPSFHSYSLPERFSV